MFNLKYVTDTNGQPRAVVVPIELWRQLLPSEGANFEELAEGMENYCLSKAMDEAKQTPVLNREEALKYLEQQHDGG